MTELKPPAKSRSTPKRKVEYYKEFTEPKRHEPAAVNVGAHAGLKNSNVYCYSNAFSALQVVFVSLISHQVKIIQSLH